MDFYLWYLTGLVDFSSCNNSANLGSIVKVFVIAESIIPCFVLLGNSVAELNVSVTIFGYNFLTFTLKVYTERFLMHENLNDSCGNYRSDYLVDASV